MNLSKNLEKIVLFWLDLTKANNDYLNGDRSPENLKVLLDTREFVLEQLMKHEKELVDAYGKEASGVSVDVWSYLKSEPENSENGLAWRKAHGAIRALVQSDYDVSDYLTSAKEELRKSIKDVAKNASLIKGYAHNSPLGSCFFDKVK
ncbi:MAG: hypothetical protein HQM10_08360 [Candidatus Riflebacteria bacterium]|nr:hypothetical protein [Candidatus Riflebacteria bacterium]